LRCLIALLFALGLTSLFHLLKYAYSTYSTMHHLFVIIRNRHYKKSWPFWSKNLVKKIPHMIFLPHVQLDQSAILDKLFWTWLFWLSLFGWSFYWTTLNIIYLGSNQKYILFFKKYLQFILKYQLNTYLTLHA
jgi:hypothetical protein